MFSHTCKEGIMAQIVVKELPQISGSIAINNGMLVLSSPVVMADWDFSSNNDGLVDHHYTVHNTSEVVDLLKGRVKSHPDEGWYMYRTAGGVHAFCSVVYPVDQAVSILKFLNVDGCYINIASRRGYFNVRVGPKPGRSEQQMFLGLVGAPTRSTVVRNFLAIHDQLLVRNGLMYMY
jgi:hypothetical protein